MTVGRRHLAEKIGLLRNCYQMRIAKFFYIPNCPCGKNLAMTPVGKALWPLERHFSGVIEPDDAAGVAGISRFHLWRAFGARRRGNPS
jgi:hypothetical protein